jgi:DNA-binding IclR family transcriptional regulator
MEVCAGTERLTPLRYSVLPIGTRVPMMCSASGRAYNAFHAESFQSSLIELLAREAEFAEDRKACQDPARVMEMLRSIRRRGAAVAKGKSDKTSILSVPIMADGGAALGALSMRVFASTMSLSEVMRKHLGHLQATAALIAGRIASRAH